MNLYNFNNYEGFKEIFGVRECNNGTKTRKNKILLSYIKWPELYKQASAGDRRAMVRINLTSMSGLLEALVSDMDRYIHGRYFINLDGWWLESDKYMLDDYGGVCEDGDTSSIRYLNMERGGKVYKMKASRFLNALLTDSEWGRSLPDPVRKWLCEEFSQKWKTAMEARCPKHTLVVDDNFYKIYSQNACKGDFCSCMVDKGQHSFYKNSVKAKAAYLLNTDNEIIARCIIYEEVEDVDTGEKLRLAERQYSTDGDDVLKRLLVDALIKGGHIDGYKKVGAGCHDGTAFVSNDGADWSGRRFRIRCDLEPGDTLSYQDSFKNFNGDYADNFGYGEWELDTTEDTFGGNYDSYHEEYVTSDLVTVYYHRRSYECSEDNLDDFVYVRGGEYRDCYVHADEVCYCEDIAGYVEERDANYSELLDEYYYDYDELCEAEDEYKAKYWTYSEYDEEYYENEGDVKTMHFADGDVMTISQDSADRFDYEVRDGELYEIKKEEE